LKYEYKTTNQRLLILSDFQGERKYVPIPLSPPSEEGPWRIIHVHVFDPHFDGSRATIIWEHAWDEPMYNSKCSVCGKTNVTDVGHEHRGHPNSVYAEDGSYRGSQ
jgi:hypothetical protein